MKKLIIMRGVSGSGKSTEAKQLAKECEDSGSIAVICSADFYFIDDFGLYNFDPHRLHLAHTFCRGIAIGAFEAKANLILIDNTNIKRPDFLSYIRLAEKYNYEIEEVVIGAFDEDSLNLYASRNTHGVPKASIQKMAERFEK